MRITIRDTSIALIHLLLIISAFFMVNVEVPSWSFAISSLSIVLFLTPTFLVSLRWLGNRDTIILFAVAGLLALMIEGTAIVTGFPYGHFSYSKHLGYLLFGIVPWTVAFAWTPLLLTSYVIAHKLLDSLILRLFMIAFLLVVFDLILDPGAVRMNFWEFEQKGWYYGVPWSNYFGWIISGFLGAGILEFVVHRFRPLLPVPTQLMYSGFLTIFFWTWIAVFASMIIPAAIGFAVLLFIVIIYRKFYYSFDDMVVLVDEENNSLATAPKLPIHTSTTPLHRAFSIFLFNKKGELLLQRRAEHKKTWGGVWSNSCCGHVMLHETVENAAKRRLKYELGIAGVNLKILLPDFRYRAERDGIVENEICPVLVGFADEVSSPNPDEVADVKWTSWQEFLDLANNPESDFSPWAIEEATLLEKNDEFKRMHSSASVNS